MKAIDLKNTIGQVFESESPRTIDRLTVITAKSRMARNIFLASVFQ